MKPSSDAPILDAAPFAITALLLCLAVATAGCKRDIECTTEVTAGAGTFKGSAKGKPDDPTTKRRSIKEACARMCVDTKAASLDACSSHCAIDAEVGKIGARTKCSEDH